MSASSRAEGFLRANQLEAANKKDKPFVLTSTIAWATPCHDQTVPDVNASEGGAPSPEPVYYELKKEGNVESYVARDPDHIVAEGEKIVAASRKDLKEILYIVKGYYESPGVINPDNNNQQVKGKSKDTSGSLSLRDWQSYPSARSSKSRTDEEKLIRGFSQIFHQSKRSTENKDAWDNVVTAVHVAPRPNAFYNQKHNTEMLWAPPPVDPTMLPKVKFDDSNLMFKIAIAQGAWELVFMYQRSLLGPTIQTLLDSIPEAGYLKPLQMMALPQNDILQTRERHRILEITQIQYNYTGLAKFGGYFGAPLSGGPAMFNHVPPSSNLFLMSDADSIQVQIGYNINFIRNAMVSQLAASLGSFYTKSNFTSLQDYVDAMKFFKVVPPIVANNSQNLNNWLNDEEFGRQRLQGMNPEMLQKVTTDQWNKYFLPRLSWTPDVDKRVTELLGGQNITAAIAQGIVYSVDYNVFDNDTLRTLALGFNRYIAAPIGLFYYNTGKNRLFPLGIQLMPNPPNNPARGGYQFHLPTQVDGADTPAWVLAKIWLNSVDGQYQEIISHLMEGHQISELFAVSFFRNLALNHPVNQLLRSHFEATLEINSIAYGDLLSYSGAINQTIGSGSIGGAVMISTLWGNWNFFQKSFKQSLINRGFLNADGNGVPDKIQGYYWREDGLKLYNIIFQWVKSVLDLYYLSDQDIVNDWELQNWVAELQSPRGGQLKGVTESGKMATKNDLYTMCTNIIFSVTAKHSAGNSGQFDYYGFTPNVPGALYIPPRINERNTTWDTIFQALPPKTPALNQMAIVYLLSNVQQDQIPMLGQAIYPIDWKSQLTAFKANLAALSTEIENREKGKPYPYLYLDPAQIGNSIYI